MLLIAFRLRHYAATPPLNTDTPSHYAMHAAALRRCAYD